MEFNEVLNKLFSYYRVSSITELASAIGAERSTVNGWKSRKALGTMIEYINSYDSNALIYIFKSKDKPSALPNVLKNYFNALEAVALATNKEDELIEDIKSLMKKYID